MGKIFSGEDETYITNLDTNSQTGWESMCSIKVDYDVLLDEGNWGVVADQCKSKEQGEKERKRE